MYEEIIIGGIYKHFKGNFYQVINLAKHSETEETMVVYMKLYGNHDVWVRPLSMFLDYKEINGKQVKRFERMPAAEETVAEVTNEKKWLNWSKQLQAISQSGLAYSKNNYDLERFEQLRDLSVEIMSHYSEMDHATVKGLFANESGYQTPKVDVRAAVFKDDKILMVRELLDNKWSLPGGWADIDLSVYENVVKESKEEAGAIVQPKRIVALLDRNRNFNDLFPYSVYKIFVECDYVSGEYIKNIETIESGFFAMDALPELSEGRNTKEQIIMCFKARQEAIFEALFD